MPPRRSYLRHHRAVDALARTSAPDSPPHTWPTLPATHTNLLRPEKPGRLIWDLLACGRRMASNPCAGRDRGHRVPYDRRSAVAVGVIAAAGAAAAAGGAGAGGCAAG